MLVIALVVKGAVLVVRGTSSNFVGSPAKGGANNPVAVVVLLLRGGIRGAPSPKAGGVDAKGAKGGVSDAGGVPGNKRGECGDCACAAVVVIVVVVMGALL